MPSDLSYLRERQRAARVGSLWPSAAEYRDGNDLWGRIPLYSQCNPPQRKIKLHFLVLPVGMETAIRCCFNPSIGGRFTMRRFALLLCVLLTYPLSSFAQSFTLALDANSASGNQSVLSVNASANQSVSIQVFGNGLTDANAVNMRFEFDANQVTYESFTAGSALPGAQVLPSQGTGFVEVGMASFGGRATASSGMLGTIGFRTTASFKSASIRLVRGELRGRGSPIVIMPNLTIALSSALSPDFDGDGTVGFNDFVLFAGVFGAKRGENRFDARFDLDSSGDIGFGDFVEFAGSFGQPVGTGGGGSGNSGGEGSGSGGGGGSGGSGGSDYSTWNLPDGAIARLGKGTLSGRSYGVAFSPDEQYLAVATYVGIWLYDATTFREIALLTGHSDYLQGIAFSPDGSKLVSGAADNTIRLWDVATRTQIATLHGHTDVVTSVAFSPDGSKIVSGSGSEDAMVRLWDVATRTQIAAVRGNTHWTSRSPTERRFYIYAVAFSPDGSKFAAGDSGGLVRLWDVATRTLIGERGVGTATSVGFTPDGSKMAASATEGRFSLWDVAQTQQAGYGGISHADSYVYDGHGINAYRYNGVGIYAVAFSPVGSTLAIGTTRPGAVGLWDIVTRNVTNLPGHTGAVTSLAFSPNGKTLAVVDSWNKVRLWNVASQTEIDVLEHLDTVYTLAFSPDGSTLALGLYGSTDSGGWSAAPKDKSIRLWDVASRTETASLQGHGEIVYSVAFSPDGSRLASGSKDNTVRLWNVTTQRETARLQGHSETVYSVAFSPDGSTLASGSKDNTVRLWNVTNRTHIATMPGHTDTVTSVAFSPDGSRFASGSADNTIRLWNTATRAHIATIRGHTNTVYSVAFSSDGSKIVSGSADNTVRLWDVTTQRETARLQGHNEIVYSVAFSANGSKIASGSADKTVRLWDVTTQRETARLQGHVGQIGAVMFSPDGSKIASGAKDGTVILWQP